MKIRADNVLTSIGMTLAATVILPMFKRESEPVVSKAVTGASLAGSEARKKLSFFREEVEDFMAEVEYVRTRKREPKSNV